MVAFSRLKFSFAFFISVFALATRARSEVLFEGFSKVMLSDAHVGFVIQRYEFDPKKKEFITIYYLRTGPKGGNLSESLKARAKAGSLEEDGFKPISYQYTSAQGEQTRAIDATFKNDILTAQVIEGKKPGVITKKVPKGTILASFLGYSMLQGKFGIKKDVKYTYKAITEEDADLAEGVAFVMSEETLNGVSSFKVLNTLKKPREESKFVSWVTHKGEVLATASPRQKITTELVATLKEASEGQSVNTKLITEIFGSMPRGQENVIARRSPETEKPADSPKVKGVPGGKGIVIKTTGAPVPTAGPTPETKE